MITINDLQRITIEKIENIHDWDAPDYVDAFIASAYWDTGEELTEEEIDELNDNHRDFVYESVIDYIH
jgi:hypothetical protein